MSQATRPIALVTGASRGIGRAIAIALAESGHDLVITGRTVVEGSAINPATGHALPGSLRSTAEAIERRGGRAHCIAADILDLDDVEASFARGVAAAGHIDVLVNNAVYVGPGNDVILADSSPEDVIRRVTGNLTSPLLLTRAFVRHLASTNRLTDGAIVGVTSDAGQRTPDAPAGSGGWSLTYAASKAGFHRIVDMITVEYPTIRAFNVNPGFVATERVLDSGSNLEWVARHGVPPAVVGRAVAEMLRDPDVPNGGYVHAQPYLRKHLGDGEYEAFLDAAKAGDDGH
jgi:NAD(P)-dependent dehydrogenase (short-subunit alcohol dehydrogenase family)